ncbi:hypothetical protein RvY_17426 [Ramazzottius varieornatus]|uniref:R3H domain-containing protein n=1 Tax=Ramazzottius varieornatus TaxID=947166 RepID=A0A1D1W234_RAMVA|nr:hypothetical protein RvY_17426 [Ramazzottius varieornatus]
MVITGKPRQDSVEDFFKRNALSPPQPLVDFSEASETASIASTNLHSDLSSVQGVVVELRSPRKASRQPKYAKLDAGPSRSGRMGVRKWRRYQNNVGLLSGITEEDNPEQSFAQEIAEESSSAFSELFEDPRKMQIWERFTRMSEESQHRFLMAFANDFDRASRNSNDDSGKMSPEQCYKRIDGQLRRLIAHRSPPVDIIQPMEEELVDFFGVAPEDDLELDVEKPDVYYRMIFHAVCQYFGLLSKSVKQRETCRTQVKKRSRNSTFQEPPQRLSTYLMQRYF